MSKDQQTADAFANSWNNLPAGSVYMQEQFEDWMPSLAPSKLGELLDASPDLGETYNEAPKTWGNCPSPDPIDRTMAFYIRLYLQGNILVKVNRASMLHSLEVRAPSPAIDLFNLLSCPLANTNFRGNIAKYLLRRLTALLLTTEILSSGKQEFAILIRQSRCGSLKPNRQLDNSLNAISWLTKRAPHQTHSSNERICFWSHWLHGTTHLDVSA